MKILVITASGLRPDFLGCYGNEWADTPAFDQLAADGIVFDQHHANWPDGAGACHAWRSGCYRQLNPPASDLLQQLHGAGVKTCLIADGKRPPDAKFRG